MRERFSFFRGASRGYTLIELLMIISVIGLMAAVLFAALSTTRAKARDAKRIEDLTQISNALEYYFDKYAFYPATCGTGESTDPCWSTFIPEFISRVVQDPSNSPPHIYKYCRTAPNAYYLAADLERPERARGTVAACSTGGPNQYWVKNK